MVDFKKLKANRKNAAAKLKEKMEATSGDGFKEDERFWKAKYDSTGSAYHVIRFLPDPNEVSYERLITYATQGPGGWYFENSHKTFDRGNDDPAAKEKARLWELGEKADSKAEKERYQNRAKKIQRKERFFSNILVIEDSENPENEVKVFLYEFGKAVYNLINKALKPEFKDETSVNVFDMWEGANVKLRLTGQEMPDNRTGKKRIVPNYDNIVVDDPSPMGTDEEIEGYWKQTVELSEFVDPKNFKPIEELNTKFEKVMGIDGTEGTADSTAGDAMDSAPAPEEATSSAPTLESVAATEEKSVEATEPESTEASSEPVDAADDDDVMKYFSQ